MQALPDAAAEVEGGPMGVAVYVSLERKIEGCDSSSVNGKDLGRVIEHVDELSAQIGQPSLMSFFSIASDELPEEFLDVEPPPVAWFSAAEGLAVVKALLGRVGRGDEKLNSARGDLESIEKVLEKAHREGGRFHLSMDI
ncbi:MAG: hypothetical protein QM765_25140 [Myxococcales bacterium]